jgi:hypothetical protein
MAKENSMKKEEKYSAEDKFSIQTDAKTLKSASEFAKNVKRKEKNNVDSNK